MSDQPGFAYIYRVTTGSVSVPAGILEGDVVWSLDARRRRRRLCLKTFRGGDSIGRKKEIRWGSTSLVLRRSSPSDLSLLVHGPPPPSARKPPRREMVFTPGQVGTITERETGALLNAVTSLLQQMEEYGDGLAIEYGIDMNLRHPALQCVSPANFTVVQSKKFIEKMKEFSWSQFYTGLRFHDDPHVYSVWSSYGVLDRIKHDPETLVEIERTDIRGCEEVLRPVNAGQVRFYHRTHDLNPLRNGLERLRGLLETTSDEMVGVMSVPVGEAREQWESAVGASPEKCGMWPVPEDEK